MKKNLVLIGICIVILLIFTSFNLYFFESFSVKSIQVGNVVITNIEIADMDAERQLGLSGRVGIEDNFGLLFLFDKPSFYGFWMKDMNFPIDIIWLDESFKVTGLKVGATPESYPQTFYPESKSLYVLETHSGLIESQNLKIGDMVKVIK